MIRVAIIGTGAISDLHISGFQKFPDRCRIVGLVNRTLERATRQRDKFALQVPVFQTWAELIREVPFDLAAVLLPPFVHAPAAIDLLNAGKHVLLEKPMAPTLEECDAIQQAAEKSGARLAVVGQFRFTTPMMRLKRILQSGRVGRVLHAQVNSFWWRGERYYDLWWRGSWEKEGGGCTLNHAIHHIDLFQWLMGATAAEVLAVVGNLNHTNSQVEDFSSAVVWFEDGALGQLTASLVHHGEEQALIFQGERAQVSAPWGVRASRARDDGFPDDSPQFEKEIDRYYESLPRVDPAGHAGQILNVLKAINGEEDLLIDGAQGRRAIELVTAIYQSGTTGARVRLPLGPDSPFYTHEGLLAHAPRFHK